MLHAWEPSDVYSHSTRYVCACCHAIKWYAKDNGGVAYYDSDHHYLLSGEPLCLPVMHALMVAVDNTDAWRAEAPKL